LHSPTASQHYSGVEEAVVRNIQACKVPIHSTCHVDPTACAYIRSHPDVLPQPHRCIVFSSMIVHLPPSPFSSSRSSVLSIPIAISLSFSFLLHSFIPMLALTSFRDHYLPSFRGSFSPSLSSILSFPHITFLPTCTSFLHPFLSSHYLPSSVHVYDAGHCQHGQDVVWPQRDEQDDHQPPRQALRHQRRRHDDP
jgi:hypothetical protein